MNDCAGSIDATPVVAAGTANGKALPLDEIRVPNKLTAQTLAKSVHGEDVHRAKDAYGLFRQLGI